MKLQCSLEGSNCWRWTLFLLLVTSMDESVFSRLSDSDGSPPLHIWGIVVERKRHVDCTYLTIRWWARVDCNFHHPGTWCPTVFAEKEVCVGRRIYYMYPRKRHTPSKGGGGNIHTFNTPSESTIVVVPAISWANSTVRSVRQACS